MTAARIAMLNRQIIEKSAELVELLAGGDAGPSNDAPAPAWLSIEDFATRLQVSASTVRRMMAEGLPYGRARKRKKRSAVRIPVAAAEAWIAGAPGRAEGMDESAGPVR